MLLELSNASIPPHTIIPPFPTIFKDFLDSLNFFPDPLRYSYANSIFRWHKRHARMVPAMQ